MLAPVVAVVGEVDVAAAGELIEGGRHLGGERRVSEEVGLVDHAQLRPTGRAGQDGERGPAFEDGVVLAEHQVIGHPERVVAQLLGQDAEAAGWSGRRAARRPACGRGRRRGWRRSAGRSRTGVRASSLDLEGVQAPLPRLEERDHLALDDLA